MMALPTRQERIEHKKFLQRQQVFENRYRKQFYNLLASINNQSAKQIENGFLDWKQIIKPESFEKIYKRLYENVSISEAEHTYNNQIKPLGGTKDFIDDLLGILGSGTREGGLINLWRGLLGDFIQVRIADRITQVTQTTKNRISFLVEKGISEGLGAREVATIIRKDKGYNKNRALAIARTETITAGNQGKYMAAVSSPYEMQKRWIPSLDARTRPSHKAMIDNPFIDLENYFYVANDEGFLEQGKYPCDNTFSASNVISCRCSISFRPKRNDNGRLIRK